MKKNINLVLTQMQVEIADILISFGFDINYDYDDPTAILENYGDYFSIWIDKDLTKIKLFNQIKDYYVKLGDEYRSNKIKKLIGLD